MFEMISISYVWVDSCLISIMSYVESLLEGSLDKHDKRWYKKEYSYHESSRKKYQCERFWCNISFMNLPQKILRLKLNTNLSDFENNYKIE